MNLETEIKQLKQNNWLPDYFELKEEELANLEKCIKNCISPNEEDVFNAFKLFKAEETNIIVIGKDPYPDNKKAHGLAFSVKEVYDTIDDSLENIYRAIDKYKGVEYSINNHPVKDLSAWAKNNKVLLLNTMLTYDKEPMKERYYAWNIIIENVIQRVVRMRKDKMVAFLWGVQAQSAFLKAVSKFIKVLTNTEILLLAASHPSPESVCLSFEDIAPTHFKLCDEFLGKDIWREV